MRHFQAITAALFVTLTGVGHATADIDPLLSEPDTRQLNPTARTTIAPTLSRPGWADCRITLYADPISGWDGDTARLAAEQQALWSGSGITFSAAYSEPQGQHLRILKSPNSGGWCGIGAGDGATLCSLPDDGNSYQMRTEAHEVAHGIGLGHGHQHPNALRQVASIDYGRVPVASMSNWLPGWPGLLLNPDDADPLNSITAYYAPNHIDYGDYPPADRRSAVPTAGDIAAAAELCQQWRDPANLPFAMTRPDMAARFVRWNPDTDVVTVTIPGGPDVLGGSASAKLSIDSDWNMTPLRQLEGWAHDGEMWRAEFTLQAASAAIGQDVELAQPRTGAWLHWSGTTARVEPGISILLKVTRCTIPPDRALRDCIYYFRGHPLVNDGAHAVSRDRAAESVLLALTGPLRGDAIYRDGFES